MAVQMVANVLAADRRGSWAVSGCPSERHLAVWELKPKRKRAQLPAAAALPMEHATLHAAVCSPDSDAGASFFVAAVEASGSAYVWECRPDGSGSVKADLRTKLRLPPRYLPPALNSHMPTKDMYVCMQLHT